MQFGTVDMDRGLRGHLALGMLTVGLLLRAGSLPQKQDLNMSADELVRETVANELSAASAPGHYMFRLRKESAEGSRTMEMIETKKYLIGRLIRINGKPLTAKQRKKEDERLEKLLSNHSQLLEEQKKQREDELYAREIVSALPQAFFYEYAATEKIGKGDECIRLKFHPNPDFVPASRKLQVLTGMEGTMIIDAAAKRLVEVKAYLFRDVNLGWGILAHLYKGGHFLMQQRSVGAGRWDLATLSLHFTGRILVFKRLNMNSVRTTSNFRRMPDNLTLVEGLSILKRQDRMKAN